MRVHLAMASLAFGLLLSPPSFAQQANSDPSQPYSMNPVLAGACAHCPWGALGELVVRQMEPYGYDVEMCYNCNLSIGPRLVSERGLPPELNQRNADLFVTTRPNRPPDFGITNVDTLNEAYLGEGSYQGDAKSDLRLIAMIETPSYLAAAVKCDSGITDLAQLRGRPNLKIMGSSGGLNAPVLSITELIARPSKRPAASSCHRVRSKSARTSTFSFTSQRSRTIRRATSSTR